MAKEFLKLLFRLKLNFCAYDYLSASTNPYFYKFILPIYIPISPGQSQEQLSILFFNWAIPGLFFLCFSLFQDSQ